MRPINASVILSISFLLLLPAVIFAALHPDVFAHDVSHTVDVGFGNSLYLVGDVDELGAGDSAAGVKMRYTDGNVWRASVSVRDQEGRRGYRFVSRSTSSSQICLSENARDVASGFSFPATELSEAPYDGKTVSYFSRWERVFVRFRSGPQTAFVDYELQRAGSGREEGEFLYRIAGIGDAGELLEFVFFNWKGSGIMPSISRARTTKVLWILFMCRTGMFLITCQQPWFRIGELKREPSSRLRMVFPHGPFIFIFLVVTMITPCDAIQSCIFTMGRMSSHPVVRLEVGMRI